jgi:hypothetical protein
MSADSDEFAGSSIDECVEAIATLGEERMVMPVDIMRLAWIVLSHADREKVIPRLEVIADEPHNHFARHSALRARA